MPIVDVEAAIVANERLSDNCNVLRLRAPELAAGAEPGQFVMIRPARGTDPLLRRPFSIFEVLRDDTGHPTGISLLNKKVGAGTTLLFEAEPGRHMACLGPLGRPFTPVDPPAEAWMVAGGVGLAPFVTLVEALGRRGTTSTLFYGGRRASDLFYVDVFERLGSTVVLVTEDGSLGHAGLVTAPLAAALERRPVSAPLALYACGPTAMMQEVAALAARHQRPAQVSLEPVMGCGLGGCYSCVVKVRQARGPDHFVRSCLEGPTFDAREIVWDTLEH